MPSQSLDLDLLQPASQAAFEAHGSFGHSERFGQKRYQGRIGFALHGRCLEFETNHPIGSPSTALVGAFGVIFKRSKAVITGLKVRNPSPTFN